MSRRFITAVALSVLVLGSRGFAHHGAPALYDVLHPIEIKGVVTEFVWSNPHAQIYLDVKDAKGNIVKWAVETGAPNGLRRAGWTRQTLKPGDEIVVRLIPAWSGQPVGFSGAALGQGKITLANGKVLTTAEKPEFAAAAPKEQE
jgi:hypothetical protein